MGAFQEFNAAGLTQAYSSDQVHLVSEDAAALFQPRSHLRAEHSYWEFSCQQVEITDLAHPNAAQSQPKILNPVAHNSAQARQTFLQVFIPNHCRLDKAAGRRKVDESI